MENLLFSLLVINGLNFSPNYSILDMNDLVQELRAQARPLLSSAFHQTPPWESFSRWSCFNKANVQIVTENVIYDGEHKTIPLFHVLDYPKNHDFTLYADCYYDARAILELWHTMIEPESSICFFAANLPHSHHGSDDELWYIQQVKTKDRKWDLELSEFVTCANE